MSEEKRTVKLELMDIQIGVTMLLCLMLAHFSNQVGISVEALAVTTGAIMCVQDSTKAAYTTALTRMLGVVCGGLFGVVIALIDNAVEIPVVFYLLVSVGVVLNLLVCKYFKMIYVQARVSCLSLLLVTMVFDGVDRFAYAVNRFFGSLVGAAIALLVTLVFPAVFRMVKKEQ